jgi:hypothetical protein
MNTISHDSSAKLYKENAAGTKFLNPGIVFILAVACGIA